MSYLKERYEFPNNVVLFSPREKERANSFRDFYKIAFKIGLRLPFQSIIAIVLNYLNLTSEKLILNGWRYLLRLIVFSESYGQDINMPIFLRFFYLKLDEKGIYHIYTRRSTKLLKDAPTSDKNWKDQNFLLREKVAEKERKKKGKKAAQKVGLAIASKEPELIPSGTVLIQQKLLFAKEKQQRTSPPPTNKDKGKAPQAPQKSLGLEDSSSPTLELSKDEGDDDESIEISSEEDEPKENEKDAEAEQNDKSLPKDTPSTLERTPSRTKDSFIKAMELPNTEGVGLNANTG
ncbi:hypothetical protein FNV43_RR10971 [Rhamnella rubrinervis]|uniref:Uncharacterized protein n=1 Tax=Rhamnella rubrinervis TaxID=2594499 RepID=A0A8K0H536_9ROSA|nr:hypothetical protein FNV43_RR10971 [Rhamnella rubrinervis]